jgi:hypothetical protein
MFLNINQGKEVNMDLTLNINYFEDLLAVSGLSDCAWLWELVDRESVKDYCAMNFDYQCN